MILCTYISSLEIKCWKNNQGANWDMLEAGSRTYTQRSWEAALGIENLINLEKQSIIYFFYFFSWKHNFKYFLKADQILHYASIFQCLFSFVLNVLNSTWQCSIRGVLNDCLGIQHKNGYQKQTNCSKDYFNSSDRSAKHANNEFVVLYRYIHLIRSILFSHRLE